MKKAALSATAIVFALAVLPSAALTDEQAPNSVKELALEVKGWHCDG